MRHKGRSKLLVALLIFQYDFLAFPQLKDKAVCTASIDGREGTVQTDWRTANPNRCSEVKKWSSTVTM